MEKEKAKEKQYKGGRNLVILGVLAIVASLATTGISLAIYHNSGDIYLDRSRPGFLPDDEEIEEGEDREEQDYTFEKSGKITKEVLDEYLKHFEVEAKAVNEYEAPFEADVLSDDHLGITELEPVGTEKEAEEVLVEE